MIFLLFCFVTLSKNCDLWPLGPLLLLLKGPPNKNGNVQKWNFLRFLLSLLTKNYVSITKATAFSHLGPHVASFKRTPKLIKIENFQTLHFFLYSFVTLSRHTKRLCLYTHNIICVFWPLGSFLKIKGPLKVPHNGVIKTLCNKNQVCKNKEENTRKWPKMALKGPKNKISKKTKRFFSC